MSRRRSPKVRLVLAALGALALSACSSGPAATEATPATPHHSPTVDDVRITPADNPPPPPTPSDTRAPGVFTFNFAGDVNFAERTAVRLAADPSAAFGAAAAPLGAADLSMVNLETAITARGEPEHKSFTFRAPATAFTALKEAGVDVATMANNHAADYGALGLQDTLAAIKATRFPVVGIGANDSAAYAPWTTTVRGTRLAVIAATQVEDETLAHFTAGPNSPGVASAFSEALLGSVQQAKAAGYVVVVYIHWGTEYTQCPNSGQTQLAATLAQAGAAAVIGTHAHQLQGAGWRPDGTYVAYGLSNYLWWRSLDNVSDDNGILTLTLSAGKVVAARFAGAHLDATGVPVPATGSDKQRIDAQWETARDCANLLPAAPR